MSAVKPSWLTPGTLVRFVRAAVVCCDSSTGNATWQLIEIGVTALALSCSYPEQASKIINLHLLLDNGDVVWLIDNGRNINPGLVLGSV